MRKLTFILLALFGASAFAQSLSQGQQNFQPPHNILPNSGFERGLSKWAYSGATPSVATSGSNLLFDKASLTWDATAASQYIQSGLISLPEGLKGVSCQVSVQYKGGDANLTLQALDGSSNVLGSQVLAAATYTTKVSAVFACPTSGTVRWKLVSTADAASVAIDQAHLGAADGLFQVSQAEFVGSAYFPATTNCEWQRTNTAVGAFGTDTDCPGPTVDTQKLGQWQTTDTNLPQVTVNNLPPGIYKVTVTGTLYGAGDWTMAISDGLNTRGYASGSGNGGASFNPANVSTAWFEYTTTGNHTFEIYGSSSSGAISLANNANNDRITYMIERYPLGTDTAIRPDKADFDWTSFTSATNVTTNTTTIAKWRRQGASADFQLGIDWSGAPSAFSNIEMDLPAGFTIDTTRLNSSGLWKEPLCWGVLFDPAGGTTRYMAEGTYADSNTIRIRYAANTGAIVYTNADITNASPFSVVNGSYLRVTCRGVPITGWTENIAAPQLVNSVVSTYAGVSKIEYAFVTASTATVSRNSSSWLSVTRSSAGIYTLNFTGGTWSAPPTCQITLEDSAMGFHRFSNTMTATSVNLNTSNTTDTVSEDRNFNITCIGPR